VGFLDVVTSQKAAKKRQKDILGNTDVLKMSRTSWVTSAQDLTQGATIRIE